MTEASAYAGSRRRRLLLQALSLSMLCGLPVLLLLPEGRGSLNAGNLRRHVGVAIYRFSSGAMPRCDQFVHPTRVTEQASRAGCQTQQSGFSV